MESRNGDKTGEEEGVLSSYREKGDKTEEKKLTLSPFGVHTYPMSVGKAHHLQFDEDTSKGIFMLYMSSPVV
ncbi:hypothetical protein ACQCT3_20910 [Sutcliffiella horikoshii]|uniref:hypothetical protein n=1 Tax=Sutcliffiella horikoshii TaxID=79883 RepID=UPI003CFAB691